MHRGFFRVFTGEQVVYSGNIETAVEIAIKYASLGFQVYIGRNNESGR